MKSNNRLKEMDEAVKIPRVAETNYALCCNAKPRLAFIGSVENPSSSIDQLEQDHRSVTISPQAAPLSHCNCRSLRCTLNTCSAISLHPPKQITTDQDPALGPNPEGRTDSDPIIHDFCRGPVFFMRSASCGTKPSLSTSIRSKRSLSQT